MIGESSAQAHHGDDGRDPRRARTVQLFVCLCISPLALIASVALLRSFKRIYGTPVEIGVYALLLLLPLLGVFGIVRFTRMRAWPKALFSIVYLGAMMFGVLVAVVMLGCSWAGACF